MTQLINQLIIYKEVCRTAMATPGRLNIINEVTLQAFVAEIAEMCIFEALPLKYFPLHLKYNTCSVALPPHCKYEGKTGVSTILLQAQCLHRNWFQS